MLELFVNNFKKNYYINGVLATKEDALRLYKDSKNPKTNPIKSILICKNNYNIITY